MDPSPLRFLCDGDAAALGAVPAGFERVAAGHACAPATGAGTGAGDAGDAGKALDAQLLLPATAEAARALTQQPELPQAAFEHAVLVRLPQADAALEAELLRLGVEAVLLPGDDPWRALRHAVERKRVERSARTAYATDLATGLPHDAQLLEHMTQLIALREREPAPMVLVALRVEGYAQAAARLGGEAGNVLRRKVAVRLRGCLRASDVVAAVGPEMFGVLLGHLEAKGDGERVAAKLVRALQQPLVVAGQPCAVAVSVGLAIYPDHGKDAASLLRRALAQAASVAVGGGQGAVTARPGGAANDEP
jgi:diguanylate cyclase (GGDEF)-like protein